MNEVKVIEELAKAKILEFDIKPHQHIRLTKEESSYDVFNVDGVFYIGSVCFEENPPLPLYKEEGVEKMQDQNGRVYALIQKLKNL